MRVVFLTHNFPRWPGDLSGAFLATLARALIERGHQIQVVAPSDGGEVGEPLLDGVPVTRVRYADPGHENLAYRGTMADAIKHPVAWRALVGLWRALRRAAGTQVAQGADLVHAHWWVPGGLASPPELPLVLTVHGTDGALLRRSALARWVAAPVFRRARIITAVSRSLADELQEFSGRTIPDSQVQPMPLDVHRYQPADAAGQGAIVVARLTPQKRVHLAIEAVGLLKQQGRPTPLTVVGGGPEREGLEALVRRLALEEQVHFAGPVTPGQVVEHLQRARVMVFPARGEGFGLVAAESFMCGVPVIACTDGGGVLDVVPDQGPGRVVAPDPEALAAALTELAEEPARQAALDRGSRWRTRLDPATAAAACEGWYREALGV